MRVGWSTRDRAGLHTQAHTLCGRMQYTLVHANEPSVGCGMRGSCVDGDGQLHEAGEMRIRDGIGAAALENEMRSWMRCVHSYMDKLCTPLWVKI